MKAIAELTLEAMRAGGAGALPAYESILMEAFGASPVPFGQPWYFDAYRQVAIDPEWLADSLVANSEKEAEGAMRLWEMSAHTADPSVAAQVRQHAIDEARHARIYTAILDTIFPGAADPKLRREWSDRVPRYRLNDAPPPTATFEEWMTLDEMVQMNIGEIRTRIHQLMLAPMASAHASAADGGRLQRMLDSIVSDETRHISYTAVLLEAAAERGQERLIRRLMNDRLREFCSLTMTEVADASFEGS